MAKTKIEIAALNDDLDVLKGWEPIQNIGAKMLGVYSMQIDQMRGRHPKATALEELLQLIQGAAIDLDKAKNVLQEAISELAGLSQ